MLDNLSLSTFCSRRCTRLTITLIKDPEIASWLGIVTSIGDASIRRRFGATTCSGLACLCAARSLAWLATG